MTKTTKKRGRPAYAKKGISLHLPYEIVEIVRELKKNALNARCKK